MKKGSATKWKWIWICFLLISTHSWAQDTEYPPQYQVVTLANTVDLSDETYGQLRSYLEQISIPTTVIVNGDIVSAIPNHDSTELQNLLGLVSGLSNVKMVILPGDRDWDDSGNNGWKTVRSLEKAVKSMNIPNVIWPIEKGCPGPEALLLNDQLLLISIQTQWWNHPHNKPDPADADCKIASEGNFNEELEDIIEENEDKNILIAGHFPFVSYGPYGGKWPLHKYLFPVPILSGMLPSFRSNVGTPKDISNDNFKPLKDEMEQVFYEQDNLIYLSGHEQNLQILKLNDQYLINSGSPNNPGYAGKGKNALYSRSLPGFITLQYYADGQVNAVVHEIQSTDVAKNKTFVLYQSACTDLSKDLPENTRIVPCNRDRGTLPISSQEIGTLTLAAGSEYQASRFKQSWFGKHYRDSWTKPVTVPILNLDTTFQGLVPFQKGGGRQTTSLKFEAGNGRQYVFRSVNKDPAKALDYEWRETVVGSVVRDQTTAQQPYGALATDVLLNEIDILHAHPELFILPDNDKLGPFQESFKGLFGMLEERPTNPSKTKIAFANADEILKSYKMFRELYEDHDNQIARSEFVRARVFDLLVGDWGKHEDNWKWAGYEKNGGTLYRPIPRDRDHVFSLWDGFLPWLADREWAKPSAANFGFEIKGIRSLMWQARHLDRFLLNEMTRTDWVQAARFIQNRIDDQIIDQAVNHMPSEIHDKDGKAIAAKLKQRLRTLDQAASDYYSLLATHVDIVGSNKKEVFQVVRNRDGSVNVATFDLDKETDGPDSTRLYFQRKFIPTETKEIRLYGLQKADKFLITGQSKSSIKLRVVGGPGTDAIVDNSKVNGPSKKTLVYEKSDKAKLKLGAEAKLVNHWDHDNYNYIRTRFAYNTYLPVALILYSADTGLGVSAGVVFTRQKFGKEDYASRHSLRLSLSTENINILNYDARFHHVLGKWDITLEGVAGKHYLFTYFFGIGNDTEKDDDLFDDDYYRTNYNTYQFSAGLAHEFWDGNNSGLGVKIHYENNAEQIDDNTFLKDSDNPQTILGIENTNIWEAIIHLDLDFRDRIALPEKGMRAFIQHESGVVTNNGNSDFGVTQGYLEGYLTGHFKRPVTLAFRFGGSKSYGDVPFYKLKYLGQRNDLRGFLRNRFTGKSTIFFNSELRMELAEFSTNFLPLRFGLKAFFDTGRVYSEFDLTDSWHSGYGGGFYIIPLKEEISLNVSVAFSDEESGILLLGIGKAF